MWWVIAGALVLVAGCAEVESPSGNGDGEGSTPCLPGDCLGRCAEEAACVALSAACENGERDGHETDVDCGGRCAPCDSGRRCAGNDDCATGLCEKERCAPGGWHCGDGVHNGDESDQDCGGSFCKGCSTDQLCGTHDDCLSVTCFFGRCAKPTCDDGLKNGDESDIDCGGGCAPCLPGGVCGADADCTERCDEGVCGSCDDGRRTGAELDVDCGGPCPACAPGLRCVVDDDCAGRCDEGVCGSCDDGRQTGGEVDVDCGGPCAPCADGATCGGPGDCAGGRCERGRCCTPNVCGVCGPEPVEVCNGVDDDCDGKVDEELGEPPPCPRQAGVCAGAMAVCMGARGWRCDSNHYFDFSLDFEVRETSCDLVDNDCDGKVDEADCYPDGDPCTLDHCENGTCPYRFAPAGTPCPEGGTELHHCQANRVCVQAVHACHCANGNHDCRLLTRGGPGGDLIHEYAVEGCRCLGGQLVVRNLGDPIPCGTCTEALTRGHIACW